MEFEPNPDERAKCARLVEQVTPSSAAYEAYRVGAEEYLGLMRLGLRRTQRADIVSLRLRRSKLFAGYEYLVAYVRDEWAASVAPDCDAFASPSTVTGTTIPLRVPPLVFVPHSRRHARSREHVSILEHEFVHINQAILGTFPIGPSGSSAEDLLQDHFDRLRFEYEANFIQLVRWPEQFTQHRDVSIEQWCLLRGHSQALERLWTYLDHTECGAEDVVGFLDGLPERLPSELGALGAERDCIEWFRERLEDHVIISVRVALNLRPDCAAHPALRAVATWFETRRGVAM